MGNIKRKHSADFKARVALELIKEIDTVAAVCSRHSIHPTQAGAWKQQALEALKTGFVGPAKRSDAKQKDELIEELYKQIGQLKVELDWLKKKVGAI